MTETTTEPRAIPRWSARDRDLWEDLFEAYSVALLENEIGPSFPDRIRQAAALADEGVKEAQFRGWVQRNTRPQKHHKHTTRRKR